MHPFETLTAALQAAPNLDAALDTLLDGVARHIKATSNDQNVQKLARELHHAAPGLAAAVLAKRQDAEA